MHKLSGIAALLVVASSLSAQTSTTPAPRFGVVAGVNLASISDADGTDNRTGFVGGAMLSLPISSQFAIQPELLYTMKGASESGSAGSGAAKINYIELPVLLRLDIPTSGGVRPFVYAGPGFSLKTSCDFEGRSGGVSASVSCDEVERALGGSESVSFASGDVGGIVGGGLAFNVGGRTLTVGARYEAGFVSIVKDTDSKNRVLSFIGTFEWPFHR